MRTKLLVGLVGASLAATALAQGAAADAIKTRQAGMKAVGAGFKGLNDQLRGTPDAGTVKRHAAAIAAHSSKVVDWFGPDTSSVPDIKTAARPEIWTQTATFRRTAADFDTQARRTLALANAGDLAALGPQVRTLGGTCKACHDDFKRKDD